MTIAVDSAPVLAAIEAALIKHNIPPSRFGRSALRDPRLVSDLRAGRGITQRRATRVNAFIQQMEA